MATKFGAFWINPLAELPRKSKPIMTPPLGLPRGQVLELDKPLVMGILNVTPDSFSDGGRLHSSDEAIDAAHQMILDGADIIDIGGESTRPGAAPVAPDQEWARIAPVVEELAKSGTPVSVDTRKAAVAGNSLQAGASIINDVSAGADPDMFPTVAGSEASIVLMHMRGLPQTMQDDTNYTDICSEVCASLQARAQAAIDAGIEPGRIALDPGIGFGKSAAGNIRLLQGLPGLVELGYPVVVGVSRKSFLGLLFGHELSERLDGSLAAGLFAITRGARILRVHDVANTRRAIDVWWTCHDDGRIASS